MCLGESRNSLCRDAGCQQTLLGVKLPRPFSNWGSASFPILAHSYFSISYFISRTLSSPLIPHRKHFLSTSPWWSPLLSTPLSLVCTHFLLPHLPSLCRTSCHPIRPGSSPYECSVTGNIFSVPCSSHIHYKHWKELPPGKHALFSPLKSSSIPTTIYTHK